GHNGQSFFEQKISPHLKKPPQLWRSPLVMSKKLIYTGLLFLAFMSWGYGQIEPLPTHDVYTPDYQTYRLEKELYSYNLIDYMFQDQEKKLWLSSVHDFKRTNGYQFFNLPQLLIGTNHVKGQIVDGQS